MSVEQSIDCCYHGGIQKIAAVLHGKTVCFPIAHREILQSNGAHSPAMTEMPDPPILAFFFAFAVALTVSLHWH
jgi:hypothetical protein